MGVDLDRFVAATLTSVAKGVQHAKATVENGAVAPHFFVTPSGEQLELLHPQSVEFDVLVEVSEGASSSRSMGVSSTIVTVLSGGVSTEKSSTGTSNTSHRIRFSVPMYLQALSAMQIEWDK